MWRFLKKLETELPYDPAISLLGIHNKETRIERDTCTPKFIAANTDLSSSKKQESSRKDIYFCFIDYAKDFDCVDHNKPLQILKDMGIQTTWPASWEIGMHVRKQQLELDMEQQTGSK